MCSRREESLICFPQWSSSSNDLLNSFWNSFLNSSFSLTLYRASHITRQLPRASSHCCIKSAPKVNWIFSRFCVLCGGRKIFDGLSINLRRFGWCADLSGRSFMQITRNDCHHHKWRKAIKRSREICSKCVVHSFCCFSARAVIRCCCLFYEHISPTPFVMLPFLIHLYVRDMCPSSRLKTRNTKDQENGLFDERRRRTKSEKKWRALSWRKLSKQLILNCLLLARPSNFFLIVKCYLN